MQKAAYIMPEIVQSLLVRPTVCMKESIVISSGRTLWKRSLMFNTYKLTR